MATLQQPCEFEGNTPEQVGTNSHPNPVQLNMDEWLHQPGPGSRGYSH